MDNDDARWARIIDQASSAYRPASAHAWRFARSKLRRDRVFRHLLERGLIGPGADVVDVGCGQGLLASVVAAAGGAALRGAWPSGWAVPPVGARACWGSTDTIARSGTPRCSTRARRASSAPTCARCRCRPAMWPSSSTRFTTCRTTTRTCCLRACLALRPGGVLLLRVHDSRARARFRFGLWADRVTRAWQGGGWARLHARPVGEWQTALIELGLAVQSLPVNGRAPFANRLLVARRAA